MPNTRRMALKLAFLALLAAGAVVRIGGAWLFRHSQTSDQGIVALMAKHIAEGKPFPVFFYGQAYMGSLEPAVSALLCRIFGYSGFNVCLGTALVGFLLLPLVYVMARDIAGRAAGLAAMALCIVGPGAYFHYMHSPRGGYAVTLLFGIFLLWYGGRLACRMATGGQTTRREFLLLGLVAGLGWWSNQLISAALLATGLLFLVVLARRAFGWYLLPVVVGFAFGSLPFWVWNLQHDWASFGFIGSLQSASFPTGLRMFFLDRLPVILDTGMHAVPAATGSLAGRLFGSQGNRISAVLYGVTSAVALVWYVRSLLRDRWTRETVQMTGLLLFLLASVAQFSSSSFALFRTPRYLLPLVPAMGIIVAVGSARLARSLRYGSAFLPVLVLVTWQTARVWDVFEPMYRGDEAFYGAARQLGSDLRERGIGVVYVPYRNHALNATLGEEFCFSDIKGERYPPYAERAEQSDEIAMLDNYGSASQFVLGSGGRHRVSGTGRFTFVHGFEPPPEPTREIVPAQWAAARDQDGADVLRPLTDGDSGSAWRAATAGGRAATLEVTLAEPATISRVRLSLRDARPGKVLWELWGRKIGTESAWKRIRSESHSTGYFWSGPRPYFGGPFHRLETWFRPMKVDAFRVLLRAGDGLPVEVTEVQAFAPGNAAVVPEKDALPALEQTLAARGVTRLFCDRWVANALRRRPGNVVETPEEQGIRMGGSSIEHVVSFTPATALLVREEDAGVCRRVLARETIAMRETPVAPWVLFDFAPDGDGRWIESYRGNDALHWAGFSCLKRDPKH